MCSIKNIFGMAFACFFSVTANGSWADIVVIYDAAGCSGNRAELTPESHISRLGLENPSWDKRIVSFQVISGKWRLWDGEDFGGNHASWHDKDQGCITAGPDWVNRASSVQYNSCSWHEGGSCNTAECTSAKLNVYFLQAVAVANGLRDTRVASTIYQCYTWANRTKQAVDQVLPEFGSFAGQFTSWLGQCACECTRWEYCSDQQ